MRYEESLSDLKYKKSEEFKRSSKKYLLSCIPENKKLLVLDVGCGTGLNSDIIKSSGHKVVGVDISLTALKKYVLRKNPALKVDLNQGFSFSDESFDLIFASEVIEHIYDTQYFLSEALRILKPNGKLVLSTPNSSFWIYRFFSLFGFTLSQLQHPGHIRFFSRSSLTQLSKEAGFRNITISGRHMYILLGDKIGELLKSFLFKLNFKKEYRFRTGKHFWHYSKYNKNGNPFWMDTIILEATKP